ncbi:hypothetical protein AGMMS49944_29750 [Spirochaetia bacterium]|nr:hypothetical protein AGMMS49944_29750 [Spirochaetia bacterium]
MSNTELLLKEVEGLPPGSMGKILDFVGHLKHNASPEAHDADKRPVPVGKKLSERFAGALRLSDEAYNAFQNSLQEGRNEWAEASF